MMDLDPLESVRGDGRRLVSANLEKLMGCVVKAAKLNMFWSQRGLRELDEEIARMQCLVHQLQEVFEVGVIKVGYVPPAISPKRDSGGATQGALAPCEEG